MSQQHQSQGSCEVRGWPGPMSLRSPAPAEGGLTLLPLSPADCKPPPGHERGAGELLRIAACLLAGLTHPPVNEIQRGKARQNTTSWEPRGLSPQPGEVPVVADANRLPPQECAHRGMEMKNTRGKNFPFYSPFAPERGSRRADTFPPVALPCCHPTAGPKITRHPPTSAVLVRSSAGQGHPPTSTASGQLPPSSTTGKRSAYLSPQPELSSHNAPVHAGREAPQSPEPASSTLTEIKGERKGNVSLEEERIERGLRSPWFGL